MKKLFQYLRKKLHIHYFSTPIVAQYWTFHSRKIIFECRCGQRKLEKVSRHFGDPFPIETASHITTQEMDRILQSNLKIAMFKDVSEGQKFRFWLEQESVTRIAQQIGHTEIYCPRIGDNTMGHSMAGGEEVYLKSNQLIVLQ